MKSTAQTRGVRIQVESEYLAERSHPAHSHWFFTYRVRIDNLGDDTVQLLSRHWIIENGHGKVEHVRGPGVVGETPVLAPGQSFGYQSFCPLDTPIGTMRGSYQMLVIGEPDDGFDATIAPFTLACPSELN
jgi:ApaG protein